MSISRWIIAVVFWLILVTSGQAQQHTGGSERQADSQEEPTHLFSRPISIDVIEDQAEADSRKRKEKESSQREIEDLAAQKGMNAATQSIEEATRDMRDYALYSTLLVAIGTALLFYTLWLTRQANRATQAAVEVTRDLGLAEHRPYVDVDFSGPISHWDVTRDRKIFWKIRVIMSNSGNTPTMNLRVRSCWRLTEPDEELSAISQDVPVQSGYLRGHKSYIPLIIPIFGDDLAKVRDRKRNLFVFVEARYETSLNKNARFLSRCGFKAASITGNPEAYWDEDNPVSIDWQHVPTYFCYDQECKE